MFQKFQALNDNTGWLDFAGNVANWGFDLEFSGSMTIQVQASEDPNFAKSTWTVIDTWTTNSGRRRMPREAGTYIRFIVTAYTNGFCYVGVGKFLAQYGELIDPSSQSQKL